MVPVLTSLRARQPVTGSQCVRATGAWGGGSREGPGRLTVRACRVHSTGNANNQDTRTGRRRVFPASVADEGPVSATGGRLSLIKQKRPRGKRTEEREEGIPRERNMNGQHAAEDTPASRVSGNTSSGTSPGAARDRAGDGKGDRACHSPAESPLDDGHARPQPGPPGRRGCWPRRGQ